MLGAFEKDIAPKNGQVRTIEDQRAKVIGTIHDWINAIEEGRDRLSGNRSLSRLKDGKRYIWLLYGSKKIELDKNGNRVAPIDRNQDEVEFWQDYMIPRIEKGDFDDGIAKMAKEQRARIAELNKAKTKAA